MDGWKSRLSGHFGMDLEFVQLCDIGNVVLFGVLSSVFMLAFLGSALMSTEFLLAFAFTFTLAIRVPLSSALFFKGFSSLLPFLHALLSFSFLLLQFFRSILVSFLFVLFVLQAIHLMVLFSAMLRPFSLLDVV